MYQGTENESQKLDTHLDPGMNSMTWPLTMRYASTLALNDLIKYLAEELDSFFKQVPT